MWRVRSIILLEKPHSFGAAFGVPAGWSHTAMPDLQGWRHFPCLTAIKLSSNVLISLLQKETTLYVRNHITIVPKTQEKLSKRELSELIIRTPIDWRSIVAWLLIIGVRISWIIRISIEKQAISPRLANDVITTLIQLSFNFDLTQLQSFPALGIWSSRKSFVIWWCSSGDRMLPCCFMAVCLGLLLSSGLCRSTICIFPQTFSVPYIYSAENLWGIVLW